MYQYPIGASTCGVSISTERVDMSNCTSRKDDWSRFIAALLSLDVMDVLHTGKNIIVEELRRWGFEIRGKSCGE